MNDNSATFFLLSFLHLVLSVIQPTSEVLSFPPGHHKVLLGHPRWLAYRIISRFIWSVPFGVYGGRWRVLFLREIRPYGGFYLVHQAGCSLGNNLLKGWIL